MTTGLQTPPAAARRDRRVLAVALTIAILHGVNDAYTAFLPPLLPRLMRSFELSIGMAAVLTTVLGVSASMAQPLLGHVADRRGRRLMIVLGPVASGVFLSSIGLAPGFAVLVALLVLGGFGSAAFHPPAVAVAARVTEGKGSGMRHAIFSFGGTLGFALGPLVAVALVARVGLAGLWVAAIPVLVVAAAAWRVLPADVPAHDRPPSGWADVRRTFASRPLALLFGISAASMFLQRLFMTLEPIVMAEAGGSEAAGAVALSVYLVASAAGTLFGGKLADRLDRQRLVAAVTGVSVPLHLLAFALPAGSPAALVATAGAGVCNMAVLPAIVVMAQELAPERAALNSGVVMGLAWAAGSLAVLGAGFLGDAIGAREAALATVPVGLVATALALGPSLRRHGRPLGS